jgi:hypothetical protein
MKPLNFDNSPCSPTASDCVIWSGPDLPCINLCKGDSISDVVEKLATELCGILDTLNISAYDLTCFNLVNCAPQTFTDLINFLIVKICELENIPSTPTTPGGSTGCPTECIINVASCFVVGSATTMSLTDYAVAIGEKICAIIDTNALQQAAIDDLDTRVTALENTVPPSYTTPTFEMGCTVATMPSGSTQGIDTAIRVFINDVWCSYVAVTGSAGLLATSISNQTVTGTDLSKVNPAAQMSAQYPGLWTEPTGTIAGTLNNVWACIKDLRDAPAESPFYLYGTTTDAGDDKTTAIERSGAIHTIGVDSYFNAVRVGLGNSNIATNKVLGTGVLSNNITGTNNTAIGTQVLTANTTGNSNTGIGSSVLSLNTSGSSNTAIGYSCLSANLTGTNNIALGNSTLNANLASNNIAIGNQVLEYNLNGTQNVGIGTDALRFSLGNANVSVGYKALQNNTSGNSNTSTGYQTLGNNTLGSFNTSFGAGGLSDNTTGEYNTSLGYLSLSTNTVGHNNIAVGYGAGRFIGGTTNPNTGGINCIYIGINSQSFSASSTNEIVIGQDARGKGDNTIQLGNTSVVRTYLQGDLTVSNATAVTTASVSQTKHFPIVINGVTYKLLLAD